MRNLVLYLSCLFSMLTHAQQKTLYCFPGQGSDHRIFDSLQVDPSWCIKVIEYGTPGKGMSMESFARELSAQIDTTQPFALLGVSLGGMICTELSEILKPKKTIIISSAKNRDELPGRYKFQKNIPLHQLFTGRAMLTGAKMMQPIVEPDRNKNKETFKSMLGSKKPLYMKRTVNMIINWNRQSNSKKIYHIHGDNDHTIPLRNINDPYCIIAGGSHMMTLTKAKEVSNIVNEILNSAGCDEAGNRTEKKQ